MSITIYTEPNFQGMSVTFDPNSVRMVYLNTVYDYETSKEHKQFEFINNDYKVYNTFQRIKTSPFTIGSVKNSTRNFYILGIGNKTRSIDVYT